MTGKTCDVAIVGAGIIGASCALALATEGLRVVLLDRGTPGREASWAAGGMLSPAPFLPGDDALAPLALESLRLYPDYIRSIESAALVPTGFHREGALELFFGESAVEDCERLVGACGSLGIAADSLTPEQARRAEPAVAAAARAAACFPGEGVVEPRALVQAALQAAAARGAEIRGDAAVTALRIKGSRSVGVVVGGEELAAAHVVIAAGCFSQALGESCPALAPFLRVRPVRGQMAALRSRDVVLQRTLRGPRGYLVPRPDGRIVAGSTLEEAGFEKAVTAAGLRKILDAAVELVPRLASAEIVETWSGLRPGTPDGLPIVGPPEIAGVVLATGHFRNGVLLAPATAQLVKDFIVRGKTDFPAEAFSPLRFSSRSVQARSHS